MRVYKSALLQKPVPLHVITTLAGMPSAPQLAPVGDVFSTENVHPVIRPHMYIAVSVCSVRGPERTLLREEED